MKICLSNTQGFTLLELVMVIALLGILAVAAIPVYQNLVTEAEDSSAAAIIGAIKGGINTAYAERLASTALSDVYPASLDAAAIGFCNAGNPCFGGVTVYPVTDGSWRKNGATSYVFEKGTGPRTYIYNNINGDFR